MATPVYLTLEEGEALVALGANLGDAPATIALAIRAIDGIAATRVLASSRLHDTAPVGPPQPRYVNAIVRVASGLSPEALLDALLEVERSLGRVRVPDERWGPRTIDLDLIAFGRHRLSGDRLVLPHPRADERLFVLCPLADLLDPSSPEGRALGDRIRQLGG